MDCLTVVEEQLSLDLFGESNEMYIHGVEFKSINEIPNEVMAKVVHLVAMNENEFDIPEYIYTKLGSGACGGVWELSDEFVLKINEEDDYELSHLRDGIVLDELQGLPLVPKLYAYSTDNRYIIIEKIHGLTCSFFTNERMARKHGVSLTSSFNANEWVRKAEEFYHGTLKRGWKPDDLHGGNMMVNTRGEIVVVDFGLFKRLSEIAPTSNLTHWLKVITDKIDDVAYFIKGATRFEGKVEKINNEDYFPKAEKTPVEIKRVVDLPLQACNLTPINKLDIQIQQARNGFQLLGEKIKANMGGFGL